MIVWVCLRLELLKLWGNRSRAFSKFLKRYKETGEISTSRLAVDVNECCPRMDEVAIVKLARKRRKITTDEIKNALDLNVSGQTICNVIHFAGGVGSFQIKKSFISERNRVKRVEWATAHLNWSIRTSGNKFCGVTNHHSFCDTRDECVCGGLKMIIRMTRDYSKEL